MNTAGEKTSDMTREANEENIISDLIGTRDIHTYIECIDKIKTDHMIILSVKDTTGNNVPPPVFEKLKQIGFSHLTLEHWRTYIGVIDSGSVVFDKCGEKDDLPVEFSFKKNDVDIFVQSQAHGSGKSIIRIDGEDYSMNGRGLNIVVYDFADRKIMDSVTYDSFLPKPTFFHKNLTFDQQYFDQHFFVPKRYADEWRAPFKRTFLSNRTLKVSEVEDGVVLPLKIINGRRHGGACDKNFNLICGFDNFSHDAYKNDRCCTEGYIPKDDEIQTIDETVIYGGMIFEHPGHLILESIARQLWYLVKNTDPELKVAVIFRYWSTNPQSFFREIMNAFGFPDEKIITVSSPTRFSKLLVPDSSELMYLYAEPYEFTKEYSLFFEHIKNNITPSEHKKIYLTKSKAGKKNIIGEDYFIDFYRKHGFKIIDPEDYSIYEKAQFMLGADEVVTTTGTNHLYAIFCKPTVKITILTRVDNSCYGTVTANMICEAINCKNIYVVNIAAGFFHKNYVWGLNLLCVTNEFRDYVKEVFHEDLDITPEESLKSVIFEYLKALPEYYSNRTFYNYLKNQKILTVLQNISEQFNDRAFDTSKLDLTTNESVLSGQVKELTWKNEAAGSNLDFQTNIIHDIITSKKLFTFLKILKVSTASILCNDKRISSIIQEILSSYDVQVICTAYYSNCKSIPEELWKQFKSSDIVLWYNYNNSDPGVRDNVSLFNIRDILNDPLEKTLDKLSIKIDMSVIDELSINLYSRKFLQNIYKLQESISDRIKAMQEQFNEANCLYQENVDLKKEIDSLNLENRKLNDNYYALEKSKIFDSQKYEARIDDLNRDKEQLTEKLQDFEQTQNELQNELKQVKDKNLDIISENDNLKQIIQAYESSFWGKFLKRLRKNKNFEQ